MEKKINCTVTSCKYNKEQEQECSLKQIIVTPIENCDTKQPDESMCSSYRNKNSIIIDKRASKKETLL